MKQPHENDQTASSESPSQPCSAGWQKGEPPKDGELYVALGSVKWADEYGGGSTPFLSQVRHTIREGWTGWLDENDLAIADGIEDQVFFANWICLPNDQVQATPS